MREFPKVALLIETSYGVGRDMIRGIARYVRVHGPWSFHFTPGNYEQSVPQMKRWGGAGMIARIPTEKIARAVIESGVPTIAICLTDEQLRSDNPLSRLSEVTSDANHIGALAAEFFLDRSYRHFAFVGLDDLAWSHRRERAFQARLNAVGIRPHIYRQPPRPGDRDWEHEQGVLTEWIRALPTPVGLLACNDDRGREVLEACQLAGRMVPEQVAVLGVDDDAAICELANPSLSSIALNSEMAGYRAAELLDGLMHGRIHKPRRVTVEALGIVTRRSTDAIAVNDPDVVAALQFIRLHQGVCICVDQVASEVALSRRTLEKRFRAAIGRTILEEIQLVRLERTKQLLRDTPHPISKVAELAGFGTTAYFVQFFHKHVGKTPRRYRADNRL